MKQSLRSLLGRIMLVGAAGILACKDPQATKPAGEKPALGTPHAEQGESEAVKGEGTTTNDFAKGVQPVPVSGINLVSYDNARVRCDYTKQDTPANTFQSRCLAVTATTDGAELLAVGIQSGVTLTWQEPKAKQGAAAVTECKASADLLSYQCLVTLKTAEELSKIEFAFEVKTNTSPARLESAELSLPYSVSIAAGLVPGLTSRFQPAVLAQGEGAPLVDSLAKAGFQQFAIPAEATTFATTSSICRRGSKIFFAAGGVIYIAEGGQVMHFAGSNNSANLNDLSHRRRTYIHPSDIYCLSDGVYASSPTLHRIHRFYDDGRAELIAGTGVARSVGDGSDAKTSPINAPNAVTVNQGGEVVFAETAAHKIRAITKSGQLKTIAGSGVDGYSGDSGAATDAALGWVMNLASGPDGSLFFSDLAHHVVRRIDPSGRISLVAGTGSPRWLKPGDPRALAEPVGLAIDRDGVVYVGELYRGVRRVLAGGNLEQVFSAGPDLSQSAESLMDEVRAAGLRRTASVTAELLRGRGTFISLALAEDGTKVYATGQEGVLLLDLSIKVASGFAGVEKSPDLTCQSEGSAHLSRIFEASALTFGPGTSIYLADWASFSAGRLVVKRVQGQGSTATVRAVHGCQSNPWLESFNPLGSSLGFFANSIGAIQVAGNGTMFLANMFKNVVLRITPDGQQSIYAGTGVNQAGPFSGIATAVPLQQPSGLALAPDGSLFVVEYASTWMLGSPQLGHRIRKITPDGRITTVAGNGRTGDAADGLAAVNAPLLASSVAVAVDGRLFVADYDNHKIRLIDTNGIMRTIAGGGTVVDFDLPIDAKEASIPFPTNIAVTRDGTLYFATGGRVIELKPRPDSSYSAAAFFGGTPTGDCGTGALEGVAKSNDSLDAAVKASMAVMCQGLVRSVAVRDTCAASGGEVRIAIGQQFDHFMNIMEVTRACRAP